jgi:ABC-type multidrug transport system ATPase subunit/ABC-type transport system involved in multi-copper enzyme maturation permease subunit
MNPLLEIWLVAARDCRKNVRSVKGLVMFCISLLGALASTFKLPKFEEAMDDVHRLDPEQLHTVKSQLFAKLYGDEAAGETLAGAPVKLVILFFLAVWLVPLLVMIIGFDGISSDLQYRSVRYWTIRTRRASYYVGKLVALWAVIALVTLVMQLMIWGVTIVRADAPAGETVLWGLRFWATSLPISGAWCGIAILMSSLSRTPMISLLMTGAVFFLLFFVGFVIGKGGDVAPLPVSQQLRRLDPEPQARADARGDRGVPRVRPRDRRLRHLRLSPEGRLMAAEETQGVAADASSGAETRLAARLDGKLAAKPAIDRTEVAIRVKGVSKTFGLKNAVDDLSLVIHSGSVFGLIGPNGAGKTTSFSMMAGYLKPTKGLVEVLGFAPDNVEALRGQLGVLPQDALLPANDKVGEFLVDMARLQGLPAGVATSRARDAIEEVDGQTWWGVRCGALSHGMAKRVQLAQALLGDPKVVLLDEPTAGLDPRIAYEVRQIIKGRKGRCTLVVSSHNLNELEEVCDSAAILDRGRLMATGTMTELTAATEEVRFKVPPLASGPAVSLSPADPAAPAAKAPLAAVRELPMVTIAEYDDERGELIVHFDRTKPDVDAETVIGAVLWVLLQQRVRISGVTKGRGLEQRVMDLTQQP